MVGKTHKLNNNDESRQVAVQKTGPIDRGMTSPWRIALKIVNAGTTLVFDLTDSKTLGRSNKQNGANNPDIDLTPFKAYELGVSRQHMYFRLRDDHVVIVDNHSVNGTWLNGECLSPDELYRIRHGDMIKLGALSMRVYFLTNPFDL